MVLSYQLVCQLLDILARSDKGPLSCRFSRRYFFRRVLGTILSVVFFRHASGRPRNTSFVVIDTFLVASWDDFFTIREWSLVLSGDAHIIN